MSEDKKPFGWRPLTDAQREQLLSQGLDESAVASIEAENTYSPDSTAVLAYALAGATLRALTKRFGRDFADDVEAGFNEIAERLEASGHVEDAVEAHIMRDLFDPEGWNDLRKIAGD